MAARTALLIPPTGPIRMVNVQPDSDFARALGCASVEGYSVDRSALGRAGYALSLFVDELRRNHEPNPRASALLSQRLGSKQLVGPALLVDDEKDLALADAKAIFSEIPL